MKKREGFKHLTDRDRDRIQALRESGHTQKEIASVLFVTPGTVSRELKRNPTRVGRYVAVRANEDAEEKRSHSKRPGMKIEENAGLKQFIIHELKRLRSPDEIAGYMKRVRMHPRVGTNAIYKWLYSDDGKPYCTYLCTKRVRKRRQSRTLKKVFIPDRISLRDRPDSPDLIHSERDLFVSPTKIHSRPCGLLIVVPDPKLFVGSILPNRESKIVCASAKEHFKSVHVDTSLADNGIENVRHEEIGVPSYYCDKGSPWQKPHVEGGIGLVRRWFLPKGTNLATISNDTFQSQLHLLNHKYRKSLGYRSAYEVALERGIIDRIPRISLSMAVAFR